jgi:hypothetical protein
MSEFLDLLETLRAEDASAQRLFGDAGNSIKRMRRDTPTYRRALAEAAELVSGVYKGRVPMYRLQEAMSTSDFPLLFGDILDRQLLGMYQEWPVTWPSVVKRSTVRDFRTVSRFAADGAEAVLPVVPQGAEYTEAALSEARYQYAVQKYGRRVPFLWEVFVNDDLDGLRSTPERLAKAARMSEERFYTELFVDATGPDATFFAAGNNNRIITGGAGLDVPKLAAGFAKIWAQKDTDGNPINTGQLRLVVPPALAVTARNIMNATEIRAAAGGGVGTGGDQITARNWMAGEIAELVVNPWIPVIDVSANVATTWYLFADPGVGRPAMEMGFLRGNEEPALFVKSPNAMRVGGGAVAAEDGDFETDGINYKVRHVFGGVLEEPKAALAYIGV